MNGRLKTAAEVAEQQKLEHSNRGLLKTMLAGSAGLGAGTGAGYLAVKGIDALARHGGGQGIPADAAVRTIGPLAGAGLGMALASWQAHQQDMVNRARQS